MRPDEGFSPRLELESARLNNVVTHGQKNFKWRGAFCRAAVDETSPALPGDDVCAMRVSWGVVTLAKRALVRIACLYLPQTATPGQR